MPTYEYECDACGHTFEEFQSMSAPALRKCPNCKKMKLQRLIGSGAGIIFKGSGFYETDYKRAAQPKPPAESGSSSSAPAPAKTDSSKPAKAS